MNFPDITFSCFQTFSWHLFGNLGNRAIEADGYGYGSGYRQHHWGKGGKGWGEHGLPNLNWALAWEGHAGKWLWIFCFCFLNLMKLLNPLC